MPENKSNEDPKIGVENLFLPCEGKQNVYSRHLIIRESQI